MVQPISNPEAVDGEADLNVNPEAVDGAADLNMNQDAVEQ